MAFYKQLDEDSKIQDVAIVTSGVFQDGVSNIETFFTSSTQYSNTGDYSVDIYRYDPSNNASASVQFGVAYGHVGGSGSLGTKGATGDRTTAAVYGQINNLINPPNTSRFTFGGNSSVDQVYAIVLNRARIREKMEPGGWELHLHAGASGTAAKIKLIDDSSTGPTTNERNFAPEYNIVSGTLSGGTTIAEAASADSTNGSYGSFYPSLGVILLNPKRLQVAPLLMASATASNTDSRNDRLLYNTIKSGSYFQAKRQEEVTSRHYFVRATAGQFNMTTNETYYTKSAAGTRVIIPGLRTDPKTYITTVGLYNDTNELLAVAKLSKPILKSKSREALIKVKLDF
tara:strand:- start:481 stop:1509 length:1029 start_codon:yes stop_codon:yes gene_type:complete